jgi:hypothetical protein
MAWNRAKKYLSLTATAACFAMGGGGAAAFGASMGYHAPAAAFCVAGSFVVSWLVMARRTMACTAAGLFDSIGSGALLVVAFTIARLSAVGPATARSQAWGDSFELGQLFVIGLGAGLLAAWLLGDSRVGRRNGSTFRTLAHAVLFLPACSALGAAVGFCLSLVLSPPGDDFGTAAGTIAGAMVGPLAVPAPYWAVHDRGGSGALAGGVAIGGLALGVICARLAGLAASLSALVLICVGMAAGRVLLRWRRRPFLGGHG